MSKTVEAPSDFMEELADFKFPPSTQRRLTQLMDKNNEGTLTAEEREDLKALVEISERMALLKGRAMLILGRKNG